MHHTISHPPLLQNTFNLLSWFSRVSLKETYNHVPSFHPSLPLLSLLGGEKASVAAEGTGRQGQEEDGV